MQGVQLVDVSNGHCTTLENSEASKVNCMVLPEELCWAPRQLQRLKKRHNSHCDGLASRFQAWTIRQVMFAACSWNRVTRLQDACSPIEGKEWIRSDQR